jgi:hypothetical protein
MNSWMAKPSLAMTGGESETRPHHRSLKFYEKTVRLMGGVFGGVAEGEAVLLCALLHALGNSDTHGEGCNEQNGKGSDRLLHLIKPRLIRCGSSMDTIIRQFV